MKHINLRLEDDLHERLKAAAEDERRSLNSQVAVFIEKCLDDDFPTTIQRAPREWDDRGY